MECRESFLEAIKADNVTDLNDLIIISQSSLELIKLTLNLNECPLVDYKGYIDENLVDSNLIQTCVFYGAYQCLERLIQVVPELVDYRSTGTQLTALHLSCYIGDFISTRILLSVNPNTYAKDQYQRLSIHYAATSSIFVFIENMKHVSKGTLNALCSAEMTPLDYAFEQNVKDLLYFLIDLGCVHGEEMRNIEFKYPDDNYENAWIPMHFTKYYCFHLEDEECENCGKCQDSEALHGLIQKSPKLFQHLKNNGLYHREKFLELPTNVHGEFNLPESISKHNYCSLSDNTEYSLILKLISERWDKRCPKIIVSFYGEKISSIDINLFFRIAIWRACDKANMWLLTDGNHNEIAHNIGNLVQQYQEADGTDHLEGIAITEWQNIANRSKLKSNNFRVKKPKITTNYLESNEFNLNKGHSNYIFIDSQGQRTEFRQNLEAYLLEKRNFISQFSDFIHIPICSVLYGGKSQHVLDTYNSMKNNIPFLLIRNSGGLADCLIECIEELEIVPEDQKNETPNIIEAVCSKYFACDETFGKTIELVSRMISYKKNFVVYCLEQNSFEEFDKSLMKCLIKQDYTDIDEFQVNLAIISAALSLDVAEEVEEFFDFTNQEWEDAELQNCLTHVFMEEKTEFLQLFLEKGFPMHSYLNFDSLEVLYTKALHVDERNFIVLKKVVLSMIDKIPERFTLDLVGRCLSTILGSNFRPYYTQKEFLQQYTNSQLNKTRRVTKRRFLQTRTDFEKPLKELYFWSILTQRIKLATFIWRLDRDAIPSALVGALILRKLCHWTRFDNISKHLQSSADIFEKKAEGVLELCSKKDLNRAKQCLVQQHSSFGGMSAIILASESESINFLSHRTCQEILEEVWHYTVDRKSTMLNMVLGLLAGLTFPVIIPLVVPFNDGFYATNETDTSQRKGITIWFKKIQDFYKSPIIRFAHNLIFYITFLVFYSYILLFNSQMDSTQFTPSKVYLLLWILSLVLEEIRQIFFSRRTFSDYLKNIWNLMDFLGISLFAFGWFLYNFNSEDDSSFLFFSLLPLTKPLGEIKESIYRISRISYGTSLFIFYLRILEFYSVHKSLGPKVIMITHMIKKDLIPFMFIYIVFIIAFGVMQWVVSFKPPTVNDLAFDFDVLFRAMTIAYTQTFGNLNLEIITGEVELESCSNESLWCADEWSKYVSVVFFAFYIVLTNVLLINLLIAMFANTYEEIEEQSLEIWGLQRFNLMREYLERSPIPPPFIILWHMYRVLMYFYLKIKSKKYIREQPLKESYDNRPVEKHRLSQWERMRALDFIVSNENSNEDTDQSAIKISEKLNQMEHFFKEIKNNFKSLAMSKKNKEFSDFIMI